MRDTLAISVPVQSKIGALRATKWAVLHRDRQIPHLKRKIYHLIMGMCCFGWYALVLTRSQAIGLLTLVGGAFVLMDISRLVFPRWNSTALKWFGSLMRRDELNRLSANSFYVFGMAVVTIFFPKPVALLSVLYLALGDPIAAMVGTHYGRHKLLGHKSWEGTLANFGACALGTFLVALTYFHLGGVKALVLGVIGGAISAIAEILPLPINDNFSIPVVSAVLLTAVSEVLRIF